ncbi:hypothetical protein Glove_142g25 [Diversispora epigaea]|uniref:Zinc-ribbon domain-containing protein n=1 Tax=Diversispora epigaea TaxID=1348612 RepID=A0A397IUP5_9GLOM|nr:hypothetical protein Glove_142g25 [Diversispora epigaea]
MEENAFLKSISIVKFQYFENAVKIINGSVLFDLLKIAIHGVLIVQIENSIFQECKNNHQFRLSLSDVKNKENWCRECMKLGLEFAQNLANEVLIITDALLSLGNVLEDIHGKSEKLDIEYAKELARSRNGECLSDVYINYKTHLRWRCFKSHEWLASISGIKNKNSWCPHCASTKFDILVAKSIARSRAGECLTDFYINCKSQLLWRCNKNHQWYATLSHITQLDIYYPQYGFATEVQGEQLERYIEFFHNGDPNNFIKQQERDQLKKELCEENWIVLSDEGLVGLIKNNTNLWLPGYKNLINPDEYMINDRTYM